jgi:hypothetical protein
MSRSRKARGRRKVLRASAGSERRQPKHHLAGPEFTIDEEVATYTVNGPVTKQYTILATEVDKGLNGLDDYGTRTVTCGLAPNM